MNAAATQLPIGLSKDHAGVVDMVAMEAHYFEGKNGEEQVVRDIPDAMLDDARAFVRKSPGVAIGVAAALGFALARVVQSGLDDKA